MKYKKGKVISFSIIVFILCVMNLVFLNCGNISKKNIESLEKNKLSLNENPIEFTSVSVKDNFWSPRIETNKDNTIPHMFDCCEKTGRIGNFAKAAGIMKGEFTGSWFFDESDVYKSIEGAAYSLNLYPDKKLESYIDSIIDLIVAAQRPDGYLNTYFELKGLEPWSNDFYHETYNAGHLFEAAIAWSQATGKRKLLDAAIKLADSADATFGPEKKPMAPQHPEIELALVKLYKITGEQRYLKLAEYFINQRGDSEGRTLWGKNEDWYGYALDEKPVREIITASGHSVRALYLYCGMADVAVETGDSTLLKPLELAWNDLVSSKMFITGGAGLGRSAEGFEKPYYLPNDEHDVDECTAIALVFFAHRMCQITGDAKYMDVAERAMYNRILGGVSLDGKKYFYGSPHVARSPKGFGAGMEFDSTGKLVPKMETYRSAWFDCACCPPNVARFLPTIGGYVYGQNESSVFVNLYVGSVASLIQNGTNLKLEQTGNYPWDGDVKITVSPEKETAFDLALRVPSWCEGITFKVNGQSADTTMDKGYARIARTWKAGDVVEIDMPMPVKRVYADPRVEANRGRVALQRGPIVYCLEGIDNGGKVLDIMLPKNAQLTAEKRSDLLRGVTVITGTAKRLKNGKPDEDVQITAIPFYVWDNRPPSGEMVVWLPETADVIGSEGNNPK